MTGRIVELLNSDKYQGIRTVATGLAVVLIAATLAHRTSSNLADPTNPQETGWAYAAYRDATYYPVVSMLDGNNPYDARVYMNQYPVSDVFPPYLPSTLLVHLPFGLVPYKVSVALYFVLNLILTVVLAAFILQALGLNLSPDRVFGLTAFVLLTRPGQSNLVLGECTLLVSLACYVCIQMVDRRPWMAAWALAVATLKPTFGVPLAIVLLLGKRPRVVVLAALASTLLCLVIVGVLVRNEGGLAPFVGSLLGAYDASEDHPESHPATSPSRIDAKGLVGRLMGIDPGVGVEILLAVLILSWGVWVVRTSSSEGRPMLSDSGPLCLVILTSIFHQPYDLVLLTLPFAVLWTEKRNAPWNSHPGAWAALMAAYFFLFFNYLGSATAYNRLGVEVRDPLWVVLSSLNGIALLFAMGIHTWMAIGGPTRTDQDAGVVTPSQPSPP